MKAVDAKTKHDKLSRWYMVMACYFSFDLLILKKRYILEKVLKRVKRNVIVYQENFFRNKIKVKLTLFDDIRLFYLNKATSEQGKQSCRASCLSV